MTSYPLAIKPCYLGNHSSQIKSSMDRNQKFLVAFSESVMKNCVKRPLAEKLRCCHVRLAIKLRYLGNHASEIKSYCGTLSGINGCSSIIRHETLREVPGGGLTNMTYPVGKTTSLSRKLCIVAKPLPWIINGSYGSPVRIGHEKVYELSWRRTDDDVMPGWQ